MHSSVSSENKKTAKKKTDQGLKQSSLDSFMLKTTTDKTKRKIDEDLVIDLESNNTQKSKKQKVFIICISVYLLFI